MNTKDIDFGFVDATSDIQVDDEPKIVKIAKLVLLLTDKSVDNKTKAGCVKLNIKNGIITQNDIVDLLVYLPELIDFM